MSLQRQDAKATERYDPGRDGWCPGGNGNHQRMLSSRCRKPSELLCLRTTPGVHSNNLDCVPPVPTPSVHTDSLLLRIVYIYSDATFMPKALLFRFPFGMAIVLRLCM